MKNWYAVYTQPRGEERAGEHLARQNFEVFLPRYLKRRSHARQVTTVPAPLFPRYIFVSFDISERGWSVIRSTRGVIDLVRNGLYPVQVPFGVIDEIRRRMGTDGMVELDLYPNLKPGTRIRIDSGPFATYEGIFKSRRDEERVIALLSLLGREVTVEMPLSAIEPT